MEDPISIQVKDILATKLGVELDALKSNASFTDDLGADSLDVMETFMEIEKCFNITITGDDAERLKTTDALVLYIKQQIKQE